MDGPGTTGNSSSQVLLPKYLLGRTLGFGSFGKVKLAQHVLTGHKVAVKIIKFQNLNDSEAEKVRREIKILGAFSHPHIIRLYEVLETRSKIYIVMEYMNCGELFYHILESGRLLEDEARYIFQQIISGVEFCHLNMVAHRDLKPENLLLDSKRTVKLADFGLSNVMRDGHFLRTSCGSPNYAAPEVISGQLYAGPEVDVWSCGVILYTLLCGRLPFDADNLPSLYKQIKRGIYTLPSHLSPGARDLIPRILVVDPMKRITVPEIRQHPWFQDHLPRYLAVSAEEIRERTKKIDNDILQEVVRLGFNHDHVIESIKNRRQNEATVTYYVLLDKRLNFSSDYYGSREELECGTSNLHHCEGTSSTTGNSLQPQMYTDNRRISPILQFPVGRNWTLGVQSPARPCEIMMEILKVLMRLNVCWKKIGDYNMKCRWIPNFFSSPETKLSLDLNSIPSDESAIGDADGIDSMYQNAVKFEMQLYTAPENRYLLDLQRVSGQPILFLEICASFLTQLRVL